MPARVSSRLELESAALATYDHAAGPDRARCDLLGKEVRHHPEILTAGPLRPDDGHYEYSAATYLDFTVPTLVVHAAAAMTTRQSRSSRAAYAVHTVPTTAYAANSVWQQQLLLAHDLLTNRPIETGAPRRTASRKHTVLHLLHTIQTVPFEVCQRAGQLVRLDG